MHDLGSASAPPGSPPSSGVPARTVTSKEIEIDRLPEMFVAIRKPFASSQGAAMPFFRRLELAGRPLASSNLAIADRPIPPGAGELHVAPF